MFNPQSRAILVAQWRIFFNRFPRNRVGLILSAIGYLLWMAMFAGLGWLAAWGLPQAKTATQLLKITDGILLGSFLFWQLMPLFLVSSGLSLDLKRLLVYPIPERRLFGIEVLLRLSTGLEVVLVLIGTAIGLWRSAYAPWWGPLFIVPFAAFNLVLSAGIRDLLSRVLMKRGLREVALIVFLLITQLPNIITRMVPHETLARYWNLYSRWSEYLPLPWHWTAVLAAGPFSIVAFVGLAAWLAAGFWFGFSQFQSGLRFDAAAQESANRAPAERRGAKLTLLERIAELPTRFLTEPFATLVQKELLSLPRIPRFRMLFMMGVFFSMVVWFPLMMKPGGGGPSGGWLQQNFLTVVVLYSMMILTEPLFANVFGYDRKASQAYFVLPVTFADVLRAKNLVASFFILIEVALVVLLAKIVNVPVTNARLAESLATVLLFAINLMAIGNLTSVRNARGIDATNPWRGSSGGKGALWMLLVYLLVAPAAGLAQLARWAFNSETAFFLVIASGIVVAIIVYIVSFGVALRSADVDREKFLAALGEGQGMIG